MYGIPNMKLDKNIVAKRVKTMQELGVEFKVNCNVGKDISFDELKNEYDAILLTGGATNPRNLEALV